MRSNIFSLTDWTLSPGRLLKTQKLDARVDAEGSIHPNLGHNVRELHNKILTLSVSLQQQISDFQALLQHHYEP